MFKKLIQSRLAKISIIVITIFFVFIGSVIYSFIPRVIQTYNCGGYKIYKILTQNPTYTININIDNKTTGNARFLYDNKQILFGNYDTEYSQLDVKKIRLDFKKYSSCKSLNIDIITGINEVTNSKFCYLLNRTGEKDYPDCSPEIKAKFELK